MWIQTGICNYKSFDPTSGWWVQGPPKLFIVSKNKWWWTSVGVYLRALEMSQEINLQQDKTDQHNRLIWCFISLLFNVNAFTEYMKARMEEITTFFRSPDNHLTQFSKTLQQIYVEDIKNNCAPTLIANKVKYLIAPIVAHS